jgi:hypothetical protein
MRVVDRLGEMPEAVTATAEAMFEAVDEDGDGRVSAEEWSSAPSIPHWPTGPDTPRGPGQAMRGTGRRGEYVHWC